MARNMAELPSELEFLRPYLEKGPRYRKASWLRCSFESLIWIIQTIRGMTINWQVPVGKERILLTSPEYAGVLEVFRTWLILSAHVDTSGGRVLSLLAQDRRIRETIDCIDYFLLNADQLRLRDHGLLALSRDELCRAYEQICSHRLTSTAVYQWPARVAEYLRQGGATLHESDLANTLEVHPFIARDLPDPIDRLTDLTDLEVIRGRVWMWMQSRYRGNQRTTTGFRYAPDLTHMSKLLYGGIIGKPTGFPQVIELGLIPGHRVQFEFPKAPILSHDRDDSRKPARRYVHIFKNLNSLHDIGLPISPISMDALNDITATPRAGRHGRFYTLPVDVALRLLRRSIEFALEHGPHLLESFASLAQAAKKNGTSLYKQAEADGIRKYLTPDTIAFGVRAWTIESCAAGSGVMASPPPVLSAQEYFAKLRQNFGLHEMLLVLFGATQVAVGALSARRIGELLDLVCGACLDASRTRLVFKNRKSGIGGRRATIARPIPPIAVELITNIEQMQKKLVELGAIDSLTNLFAQPQQRGEKTFGKMDSCRFYMATDYFCDYIEAPLNSAGQRHYVRQHQLRRFFAMLFFWGAGFGGMDALRYFLGHTNAEHAWRYISESVPGFVLRGVQAEFAIESVYAETPEARALSDELERHFNTRRFQLVEAAVLSDYIEDLIEEGTVTVEPQFLDGGETYRIAILVRPEHTKQ